MKMSKDDLIKVVGIAGTVLGVGATLLQNWSSDQKLEKLVNDKVKEILDKELQNR